MSDLINRQMAIDALIEWYGCEPSDLDYFKEIVEKLPSADRPQGFWTKVDVATYRCSECGKIQIADDVNELNFCCCCGSRNKVRRLKGADDEADNI